MQRGSGQAGGLLRSSCKAPACLAWAAGLCRMWPDAGSRSHGSCTSCRQRASLGASSALPRKSVAGCMQLYCPAMSATCWPHGLCVLPDLACLQRTCLQRGICGPLPARMTLCSYPLCYLTLCHRRVCSQQQLDMCSAAGCVTCHLCRAVRGICSVVCSNSLQGSGCLLYKDGCVKVGLTASCL